MNNDEIKIDATSVTWAVIWVLVLCLCNVHVFGFLLMIALFQMAYLLFGRN
jgi:hypothetical protein